MGRLFISIISSLFLAYLQYHIYAQQSLLIMFCSRHNSLLVSLDRQHTLRTCTVPLLSHSVTQ